MKVFLANENLKKIKLDISGAYDVKVPYLGYCLIYLSFPSVDITPISVLVLVVPDTGYSRIFPVNVGTSVISYEQRCKYTTYATSLTKISAHRVKACTRRPIISYDLMRPRDSYV